MYVLVEWVQVLANTGITDSEWCRSSCYGVVGHPKDMIEQSRQRPPWRL